jgi:hypothetical protein
MAAMRLLHSAGSYAMSVKAFRLAAPSTLRPCLADLNPELQQLAVDAGRTPPWVAAVHLPDQITNFAIY